MNRILPDRVVDAYKTTGLLPAQEEWAMTKNGKRCGCGLTACLVAAGDSFEQICSDLEMEERAQVKLCLTLAYTEGFITGFDDNRLPPDKTTPEHMAGFEDGQVSLEAVKTAGLYDDDDYDDF